MFYADVITTWPIVGATTQDFPSKGSWIAQTVERGLAAYDQLREREMRGHADAPAIQQKSDSLCGLSHIFGIYSLHKGVNFEPRAGTPPPLHGGNELYPHNFRGWSAIIMRKRASMNVTWLYTGLKARFAKKCSLTATEQNEDVRRSDQVSGLINVTTAYAAWPFADWEMTV